MKRMETRWKDLIKICPLFEFHGELEIANGKTLSAEQILRLWEQFKKNKIPDWAKNCKAVENFVIAADMLEWGRHGETPEGKRREKWKRRILELKDQINILESKIWEQDHK